MHSFAAAGCNASPGSLAAGGAVVAYGAGPNVVVVGGCAQRVEAVLRGAVAVAAVAVCEGRVFVAACDGGLAVWECVEGEWLCRGAWKGHSPGRVVAAGWGGGWVSVGMDGWVRGWHEGEGSWSLGGECEIGGGVLPECVDVVSVGKCLVCVVGGTDRAVRLFVAGPAFDDITFVGVLRGHRDWVRGLQFCNGLGGLFLASASTDSTARVWWMAPKSAARAGDDDAFGGDVQLEFHIADEEWTVAAVALLDEHTAAVHSVAFESREGLDAADIPRLVTSSMDCSVAVWRCVSEDDHRWSCVARFGLMGGSGAHALGFFGAAFASPGVEDVVGHNFGGALHCWRRVVADESGQDAYCYVADSIPGGHFAAVTDLAWEPRGRYFITCSADKTTRIFAHIDAPERASFVEWARPQVHGHAIFALAFCNEEGTRFVSGAEERMLRVFDAPLSFMLPGESPIGSGANGVGFSEKAASARMPELGLSNKAVFQARATNSKSDAQDDEGTTAAAAFAKGNAAAVNGGDAGNDLRGGDGEVVSFGAKRIESSIPLETELKQGLLWPESGKLYGHGNEISCVDVAKAHGVLASACRAQSAKDADILLWDVNSGVECGRLSAHELTINQLRFSDDGNALLSVSRDRSFAVFVRDKASHKYDLCLAIRVQAAHTRLLYTGAWLFGTRWIVTGGRDKFLKAHPGPGNEGGQGAKRKYAAGVSAVDTLRVPGHPDTFAIALGLENGDIDVLRCHEQIGDSGEAILILTPLAAISGEMQCGARVTRVAWRPCCSESSEKSVSDGPHCDLGVASEDCSVRVHSFSTQRICAGAP